MDLFHMIDMDSVWIIGKVVVLCVSLVFIDRAIRSRA